MGCNVTIQRLLVPGITVSVINETDSSLDHVQVTFTGGACRTERIKAGGQATWHINPHGESGITLAFRDAKGQLIVESGDLYIESGYRGSVQFHVARGGIRVIDKTRPGPF
jgi:hypothetical protein